MSFYLPWFVDIRVSSRTLENFKVASLIVERKERERERERERDAVKFFFMC